MSRRRWTYGLGLAAALFALAARDGCGGGTLGLDLVVNVTEQGTNLPIPNATVTVTDDTLGQPVAIQPNTTDDNGRLEDDLTPAQAPPGHDYTVQVSAPGYQPQSQTFHASQQDIQSQTVPVALTPTQPHLAVTVEDASTHASLVGAGVSVSPADAQPPLTDANGVSFFALNAGTPYAVTASLAGYATSPPQTVSFDGSNAGQTLTILLQKQAPLIVQASDVSTNPPQGIPGASVNVFSANRVTVASGQTGADGSVTLFVDPGNRYGVEVQAPGFIPIQDGFQVVSFPPGSTAPQTVQFSFVPSGKVLPP